MVSAVTSQSIPLQGVVSTMQGGRPENQDDWGCMDTPLGFLLVVCDGMGGGPGGKTASYIAKCELMAALQQCSPQMSRIDALKMAVSRANDALYRKMDEVPSLRGMGSTLVAVLINQYSAVVAHLGDSRCYRISKEKVVFRTDDHSLVGELVRNKAMTEEQARLSPQSNVITRGLGNTSNHVAEIVRVPFCKGDRLILCTDGVWGCMPHDQLVQRLTSNQTLASLVSNLAEEVDQRGFAAGGNHDNHTLAAIEMQTDSILKDKMSRKLKLIFGIGGVLLFLSLLLNIISLFKSDGHQNLAEIEQLERKNQELEASLAVLQESKEGGTKDLITQVEVLRYEKQLLEERQEALINKVDSLEKIIAASQASGAPTAKAETTSKTTNASVTASAQTASTSPKELAQHILNLFKDMENAKGSTWQEAAKKKAGYRQKILESLLVLDKKTNGAYASTIDGIKRELQHPKPQTDLVDKNPANKSQEEYVSTRPARQLIQKLSQKVQEIKNKLQ